MNMRLRNEPLRSNSKEIHFRVYRIHTEQSAESTKPLHTGVKRKKKRVQTKKEKS